MLADGLGGAFVLTADASGETSLTPDGELGVHLIHLGTGLAAIPIGDLYRADDPCGALVIGGRGSRVARGALLLEPGSFVAVGEHRGADPDREGPRVFFQGFDAAGNRLFGPGTVSPAGAQPPTDLPVLARDGEGGFFLGWHERAQGPAVRTGLLLQRFDRSGSARWGRPAVLAGGSSVSGLDTVMVADRTGGVFLAWSEWREGSDQPGHLFRIQRVGGDASLHFEAGGLPLGEGGPDGGGIALLADGRGGAIVAYERSGMRAHLISASGTRPWGDPGVLLSDRTMAGLGTAPGIAAAPDGVLYVVWREDYAGGRTSILARRLDLDGSSPWPAPVTLASDRSIVLGRSAAILDDASLAVVWDEIRGSDPGDASDIYVQAVDRRGRIKGPPDGIPIAAAPDWQRLPFAFPAPSGDAADPGEGATGRPRLAIVWSDDRFPSLVGRSTSLMLQEVLFLSSPRLDPFDTVRLRQGAEVSVSLHGDDLQRGLDLDAAPAVTAVLIAVAADAAEGPGDRLTVTLRAAGDAPLGGRDLVLVNPDGGATTVPGAVLVELNPRRADIDRSGRVDGYDLALLARAFGRAAGEERFLPDADIDADGTVDGADLALLASRFGARLATGPG
ncbi:MAG: dockerin type I domain-containing protein [Acidobacteriota bacterium]